MEVNHVITVIVAVFASTGFWAFINDRINKRKKKKSAETKMLLGLAHDRIYELCNMYIRDGRISHHAYDNLMYLYKPYKELGGNGTAERLMEEVDKLPIIED